MVGNLNGGPTPVGKGGRPANVAADVDSYRLMVDGLGQEVYENHLDLVRFQTWLVDQGLMSTGYVHSVNNAALRHTTLFWGPGPLPPADPFRKRIESEAEGRNIDLSFDEVPYTRQDIEQASLFVLDNQGTPLVGFPVYYVDGPTPESPYLTVVGTFGSLDPQELGRRLQASLRINLTVVVQEGEPLIPFSVKGDAAAPSPLLDDSEGEP